MQRLLTAFVALVLPSLACAEMKPFAVQWPREAVDSPADLSFLLEAPAGKAGFVRIADGHFIDAAGKRLRFWGLNVSGKGCLPPKEDAPAIAANLARLGVNCIRFHFFDRPAPNGIIAAGDNTRSLDPGQLDKLDAFIAELKKRGIYSNINLNVARGYKAGDGVKDHELLGFAKALTYFDPRIIELQKEYARQLLTHKNPYTGNEYRNEPAVAIVELLNENSLTEAWYVGRLIGKNTRKNPGTWTDIPENYAQDLTRLYNQWLEKTLAKDELAKLRAEAKVADGQPLPRLVPGEFAKAPADRFRTEARFYMSVEADFLTDMRRLLKEELKVRASLVANSDHGHWKTGYPQVVAGSLLDVVDGHVYWQHPSYVEDPKTGKKTGFFIPNTPMVDNPLRSSVVQLSRSAVAGKPYTVSEFNHPFPSSYACEGVPILAAYAAFQDWDGIFCYTLCHDDLLGMKSVQKGHFDYAADPVKMSQIAAGALMFLRGDVSPAKETILRSYTRRQVIDSIRMRTAEQPYYTPGFDLATPLRHGARIQSFDGPETSVTAEAGGKSGPIRTDTGELAWNFGEKEMSYVTINTPNSQAIVGEIGCKLVESGNAAIMASTPFCAVSVGSLDAKPIGRSSRLLLTAGSTVENSDMKWNEKRTTLESWGKEPSLMEVVTGNIVLKLENAKRVMVTPLDGAGRAMEQRIMVKQTAQGWEVPLGGVATTWYVVSVER